MEEALELVVAELAAERALLRHALESAARRHRGEQRDEQHVAHEARDARHLRGELRPPVERTSRHWHALRRERVSEERLLKRASRSKSFTSDSHSLMRQRHMARWRVPSSWLRSSY